MHFGAVPAGLQAKATLLSPDGLTFACVLLLVTRILVLLRGAWSYSAQPRAERHPDGQSLDFVLCNGKGLYPIDGAPPHMHSSLVWALTQGQYQEYVNPMGVTPVARACDKAGINKNDVEHHDTVWTGEEAEGEDDDEKPDPPLCATFSHGGRCWEEYPR